MRRRLRAWKTYSLIDRVPSAKQKRKSRVGIRMARRLAESTRSAAKRGRLAKWSKPGASEPVLSRAEGSRFLPGPPATGAPTNRSSFVGKGDRGPHEQVFVRGAGQFVGGWPWSHTAHDQVEGAPGPSPLGTREVESRCLLRIHAGSSQPGAPGLDSETWESTNPTPPWFAQNYAPSSHNRNRKPKSDR
jgi:hypothetical protein